MSHVKVPDYVLAHPLWEGCGLQLSTIYLPFSALKEQVAERVEQLQRCDDLTPREKTFLVALKRWKGKME